MDFGYLFYMGFITLVVLCCPPIIAFVAVGIIDILNRKKVINVSNRQILVLGIISFIIAFLMTSLFVQIASNGVYAM
jgi:hypothetical protein